MLLVVPFNFMKIISEIRNAGEVGIRAYTSTSSIEL